MRPVPIHPPKLRREVAGAALLLSLLYSGSAAAAPGEPPSAPRPSGARPAPPNAAPAPGARADREPPKVVTAAKRLGAEEKPIRPAARATASRPAVHRSVPRRPWYRFEASLEMGFVAPVYHRYQQGADGTYFDFVKDGGQGNLFLFLRASAGVRFVDRHVVLFLYQPLTLNSRQTLREDVRIQGLDFPAGTPINVRYGFDFYRLSYMYDIFRHPRYELAVGLSLQIRNADISITSGDGTLRAVSQNLGPVPLLKVRGRYTFRNGVFLGLEADGIYASSKILNGSTRDVTGAILDLSLRVGMHLRYDIDVFANLRYLGGGAEDGGKPGPGQADDYDRNWLHFLSLSLGVGFY